MKNTTLTNNEIKFLQYVVKAQYTITETSYAIESGLEYDNLMGLKYKGLVFQKMDNKNAFLLSNAGFSACKELGIFTGHIKQN